MPATQTRSRVKLPDGNFNSSEESHRKSLLAERWKGVGAFHDSVVKKTHDILQGGQFISDVFSKIESDNLSAEQYRLFCQMILEMSDLLNNTNSHFSKLFDKQLEKDDEELRSENPFSLMRVRNQACTPDINKFLWQSAMNRCGCELFGKDFLEIKHQDLPSKMMQKINNIRESESKIGTNPYSRIVGNVLAHSILDELLLSEFVQKLHNFCQSRGTLWEGSSAQELSRRLLENGKYHHDQEDLSDLIGRLYLDGVESKNEVLVGVEGVLDFYRGLVVILDEELSANSDFQSPKPSPEKPVNVEFADKHPQVTKLR